jgi:glutathione-specific gamma-glutamylcyclotransferase
VFMQDFWVFGYASLMWRPGFNVVESRRARLHGYHRALCIASWEHRGTRARPGLVMGLDKGGSCVGMALKVAGRDHDEVMAYLRARELVTHVYKEKTVALTLDDGTHTRAVTYVADRAHQQYAGKLAVDDAVAQVCGAVGDMGPNEDYVTNTADHVAQMGIRDRWLEAVVRGIKRHHSGAGGGT